MMNEGTAESAARSTSAVRKIVYAVTERGDKSWWTKVGVSFENRDGSQTLRLDAVPVSGVLIIRDEEPSARRHGGAP